MLIFSILLIALVSFANAEFLGRRKHIGRGWSFALSFTGFIVIGLLATLISPSARKKPTKGHIIHLIVGVLLCIHGLLTFIMFSVQAEPVGISQAIAFMCLGTYLIVLSSGKVVNNDPKYYFTLPNFSRVKTTTKVSSKTNTSTPPNFNSNNTDFLYFLREGEGNSEPKTFTELKSLKLTENTPVWRKGLEKWVLAKDLQELESIILYEPPIFEEPVEKVVEENAQAVPPPFTKQSPPPFDKTN